jgi:hypothetical protein
MQELTDRAALNLISDFPIVFCRFLSSPVVSFHLLLFPVVLCQIFLLLAFGKSEHSRAMPEARQRELKTFDQVVKALGGKRAVGVLLDQNTAAVCNWERRRKRFPTKYYMVMIEELEARGAVAPDHLWGFYKKK